jgi:hypothetical protein
MARGRLINQSISASLKFHNLPDDTCRLFASWTIAYLDKNGVFYGNAQMVKSAIFPRRTDITAEQIEAYLQAMERIGLIIRFVADGDEWQWWPGFLDNQPNLRREREKTGYPLPPEYRQDDGNAPDDGGQDDGDTPAEVKLSESNSSESNSSEEKPPPLDSQDPVAVYTHVFGLEPSPEGADYMRDHVPRHHSGLWLCNCTEWLNKGWDGHNVTGLVNRFQNNGGTTDLPGQPVVFEDIATGFVDE